MIQPGRPLAEPRQAACNDEAVADSPETVLLEEARRAIDAQVVTLDALQTKAIAILGAGAIVAGLAAPRAFGHAVSNVFASIALAAFALGALVAVEVMRPRKWAVAEKLGGYLQGTREHANDVDASRVVAMALAEHLEKSRMEVNRKPLLRLQYLFTAQCLLLAVQVLAWAVAYALA